MGEIVSFFSLWVVPAFCVIGIFFVLVLIHELGHFAVGRYIGAGVDEFSIGFGPALMTRKDAFGTLWSIRIMPLGGFVKFSSQAKPLQGEEKAPQSGMEARLDALSQLPILRRAMVVLAGPIANIILAFVLFFVHSLVIEQESIPPVIGAVSPGSVAYEAGLSPGDRVQSINDREIKSYRDIDLSFESNLGENVTLSILRNGDISFQNLKVQGGSGPVSIAVGLQPHIRLKIISIEPGSEASRIGLRVGDLLLGYDDKLLTGWQDFADAREAKIGKSMALLIERDGARRELVGSPEARFIDQQGNDVLSGVFGFGVTLYTEKINLGPWQSLSLAVQKIHQFSTLIFKLPGQFVRQQRDLDDLGGPVRIAEEVGRVVIVAPSLLLFVAAILSLQLGIINLFPIPVLDGGHLLLYMAEGVAGRPLPTWLLNWLYRAGGLVLVSFFLIVTFNDLARLLS